MPKHLRPCGPAALVLLAVCLYAAPAVATPVEADSLLARAGRAVERGELQLAVRLYEKAEPMVDDGRVEIGLARVALAREDHDAVIKHARRAIKRDRENSGYHLTLAYGYGLKAARGGMSAVFYAGKFKGACEEAVKYDPENVEAHFAVLQYYLMAPGLMGGGEEKAQETISTIESLDPYYGHLARAVEAWVGEDTERAESEYVAAARVDSTSPEGWALLGMFYMEEERYAAGVPVWERALALDPDDLEVVYALAKARLLAGTELDAAAEGFRRYIEEGGDPRGATEAEARWRLGMTLDRAGMPLEAHGQWRRALALDPELDRAAALIESVEAVYPELN
ncbi:MAG: tetratricopeptide repeat protein [Candidatus Eisenbacteria bacterium]|nr:tetratricopeptide repeat protein [Candidatus Eisenbacteria bacterium]